MNLTFYGKFLIIAILSQIYSGVSINELKENQVEKKWFPAIFRIPHHNSSKNEYNFECLGVLVHHRAVLASASCVPIGMKDVTSVRFYDWDKNLKIKEETIYVERNLSDVLDFLSLHPGEVGTDDVHILKLSEEIDKPQAVIFSSPASYNYEYLTEWKSHDEKKCFYVTTEGNMTTGMTIKMTNIERILKYYCCTSLNVEVDDLNIWYPSYYVTTKCGVRLFGRACFNTTNKDTNLFDHRDPSICPDNNNNPYLQGFVVEVNEKVIEFSNFDETISWIKEYLLSLK